uniref:cysteine dioxygenase n=1 Tax=Oryza sativa subsp. japonica TaxID=39947 RepID=Q5JPY5_ORYSJ|nr:OSJNBa0057M08.16 [Oryza sativa Japonica Group]
MLGVYDFTGGLPPSPPTGVLAYTVAIMPPLLGICRLHRRPASVAAEWCLCLHGWPIMPPLLGVYDFTAGPLPSPPSGASAYTAGLLCRRCWASATSPPACLRRRRVVPPPTRLAYYAAAVGRLRLHRRPASAAAEWCLRLHGWSIMPPLLGVYDFTAGLPPPPPSGASAYTAGLLCRRCWASTTSPPACLRRRRVVPPPTRLAYYAAAVGRLRLHRRPASVAAEWCLRLHGWPIMPPLLGVYDFTAGLPPSPPSGASAYTAGLLCRRCWASTTSPPACLRRRRVVPPPTRLVYYAAAVGRLRLHRRPTSVAAEWCLRLHGWPIMPPLLGVYDFTAGLPSSPPTGVIAYTVGRIQIQICIKGIHGFKLISYAPGMDQSEHHHRLASTAADWCFRLHGWPLCRRCWASTSSPTGLPSPPPTGVSACTAGLYAAVVGRLRLHRPVCLRRRRLVFPPARLAFMPPLLGVYVFTNRPPRPPPTGVSACTAGLYAAVVGRLRLHRPACLRRRRLVFPPARLAFMPPLLGVYVFTDRLAFAAADWCPRLHGWPIMTAVVGPLRLHRPACLRRRRLVFPPARLAYYAAVVGRLRLHRPACLRRRRLVFPPARLAFMPPLLGIYVFTDRLAFAAADWCFRLHGWPIMPPLLGVYVFTDRLAFAAADWCFRLHG